MTEIRPTSEPEPERLDVESLCESVLLLKRFRSGDEQAATLIFERFAKRLSSLVQSRLSRKLAQRLDAEDVVMSAYRSFFVRARAGQFAVDEPGDLWRLLAQITLNKLYRSAEWNNAARRTFDREQNLVELANQAADANSSPELAVIVTDQLDYLMSQLTQATSHVLELRLQGHDVDEIAALIGRSPRTVRRQLETIRNTFTKLAASDDSFHRAPLGRSSFSALRCENEPVAPQRSEDRREDKHSSVERRSLDEFVLRRQIGLGLTGRVYEAFDKWQQKLVAVKVLRKSLLADLPLRERFESEADIAARLDHPGIVRIHGHGETPNRGWFLVMDLVPNGELTPLAGHSLPVEQAVDWIRQVATAIGYAHDQGVIHCDLKPANLLISADGHVIVTDFGFAQLRAVTGRQPSGIAGTPAFMAPEQIDAAWGKVGPHTDIYGLGAVLFFLLTGRPPVNATRVGEVFAEITSRNEAPNLSALRPDVSPEIAAVCHRCLGKSSGDRYPNTNELLKMSVFANTQPITPPGSPVG